MLNCLLLKWLVWLSRIRYVCILVFGFSELVEKGKFETKICFQILNKILETCEVKMVSLHMSGDVKA